MEARASEAEFIWTQVTQMDTRKDDPIIEDTEDDKLSKNVRTIYINDDKWNSLKRFWSNYIWTTKYTWYTYLPLCLLF